MVEKASLTWSRYQKATLMQFGNKSALYRIRLVDPRGQPYQICRLAKKDAKGLLYIGESTNLGSRIKDFNKSHDYLKDGHEAGIRLRFMEVIHSQFNKGEPEICFALADEKALRQEEARLLGNYFLKFGELPPLNSIMPYYTDTIVLEKLKHILQSNIPSK